MKFINYLIKKYNIEKEYIKEQKGNYRETLRENEDALRLLGWKPVMKLQDYIESL